MALLAFDVAGAPFALDLACIREILPGLPVTRVPLAPEALRGVVNVRGTVLPVLDVAVRLGDRPAPIPGPLVLVERDGSACALLVDGVRGILEVQPADLFARPATGPLASAECVGALAPREEGAGFVPVLDLEALLDAPGIARARASVRGSRADASERAAAGQGSPDAAPSNATAAGGRLAPGGASDARGPTVPSPTDVAADSLRERSGERARAAAVRVASLDRASALPGDRVRARAQPRSDAHAARTARIEPRAGSDRPAAAPAASGSGAPFAAIAGPPRVDSAAVRSAVLQEDADPAERGEPSATPPRAPRHRVVLALGGALAAAAVAALAWAVSSSPGRAPSVNGRSGTATAITSAPSPLPSLPLRGGEGVESAISTPRPLIPSPSTPGSLRRPYAQGERSRGTSSVIVRPGDTLWDLARRVEGTPYAWPRLHRANAFQIPNPDRIEPGQRLVVPAPARSR